MKRKERHKKGISLLLLMVLCLVGVYGTGSATDVPVYTSVSCALRADLSSVPVTGQADGQAAEQILDTAQDTIRIPVERFYQDCIARLPETDGPLERMEQDQATVLLERCRQVKRSGLRDSEVSDSCVIEIFGQPAGSDESVDAAETASSDSQSRIIAYIHDQDGQKEHIL